MWNGLLQAGACDHRSTRESRLNLLAFRRGVPVLNPGLSTASRKWQRQNFVFAPNTVVCTMRRAEDRLRAERSFNLAASFHSRRKLVRRSSGVERLVYHTAPLFRSSSLVLRDPDLGDCAWITVCLALGRRFWGPYWCTQRKVTSMLFLLGPVRALEPVFNGVEEVHVPAGHTSQDLVQAIFLAFIGYLAASGKSML
ncbi:hypothetical protein MRX96_044382 [Rhipicephalus microplus]